MLTQFRGLFDAIKKNDLKKSDTYRDILGHEAVREQEVSDFGLLHDQLLDESSWL